MSRPPDGPSRFGFRRWSGRDCNRRLLVHRLDFLPVRQGWPHGQEKEVPDEEGRTSLDLQDEIRNSRTPARPQDSTAAAVNDTEGVKMRRHGPRLRQEAC